MNSRVRDLGIIGTFILEFLVGAAGGFVAWPLPLCAAGGCLYMIWAVILLDKLELKSLKEIKK